MKTSRSPASPRVVPLFDQFFPPFSWSRSPPFPLLFFLRASFSCVVFSSPFSSSLSRWILRRYISLFTSSSRSYPCFLVFSRFLHLSFFSFLTLSRRPSRLFFSPSFISLSRLFLRPPPFQQIATLVGTKADGGGGGGGGGGGDGGEPNYGADRDAANF